LVEIAADSAPALRDTERWLHRRVERIRFTERTMFRRDASVDFTVPADLPEFRSFEDGTSEYYVPIALLRKWPPRMKFDLRGADGEPLSLLTSAKNREVDAIALHALAPPGSLLDVVGKDLKRIALDSEAKALEAFDRAAGVVARYLDEHQLGVAELSAWNATLRVAGALVANSILWVRVRGRPGDRHVVKFSFEYPAARNLLLHLRVLTALSWVPIRYQVEIPTLGERGSQHLEVELPADLELQRVQFRIEPLPPTRPAAPSGGLVEQFRRRVQRIGTMLDTGIDELRRAVRGTALWWKPPRSTEDGAPAIPAQPERGKPYAWNSGERAYFYIAGSSGEYGLVTLHIAVAKQALINGALWLAIGTATLLTVFTAARREVIEHIEPAVTALLLVPAILGYMMVRPGEHPMLRQLLAGVRVLLTVAGGLPVAAAVVLVAQGLKPSATSVLHWWLPFTLAAWAVVALLTLSWLLPAPRRSYAAHPAMPLPDGGYETQD
jgi:hypothetical protein